MKCNEKGLSDSHYYFFTPSVFFQRLGYYITVCGAFHAQAGYEIKRKGGVVPLLFFVQSGRLNLRYEGISYIAKQGQIVLINCNRPHSYHVTSNCDFVFFHLAGNNSDDIVDELIATNGGILFQLPNARVLFQKAQNYLDTMLEGGSPSEAALSSFVYETLCNLRLKGLETLMQKNSTQGSMSKVLSYIRDHVKEPLSLEQLSEIACMSKYHFLRSFQKEYGETPFQYIAEMRMSLSKTMLTTTNLNIAEIAYDLGYSNESAFIRAFTRIVGISPKKFKRGLQG